ncbi:MAG: hypothetical protein JW913_07570 [Chitinispirillaceae bacterium]|nr:hypothetical protein [Chitinispirillaceae bacterium]
MDITFQTCKLEKTFNSERELVKAYGKEMAKVIKRRMAVLAAAGNLEHVSFQKPERRHEVSGARKGEFAVDLTHPYRLTFKPEQHPLPRKPDGGLDLRNIQSIKIIDVEDYH